MNTNSDEPAVAFVCEEGEHHWVSSHEPHAPIWIIECSKCGRHDFTGMLAAHDREVAAKAWDEGYEAGQGDEAHWSRGLSSDPGADEHPHDNPYAALVSEPSTPAPVEPERPTCTDFHWVGQAFSSCDMCGKPFWDHVTHRGEPISDEFRAGVKRKWEVVKPTTDTKGTP
jgi:hypothetical protein